jgi:hypothetical protein
MQAQNHNFIRLWAWEQTRWHWATDPIIYFRPNPFLRVAGYGNALDGGIKFDLNQFNQEYFDRLRARVIAAHNKGIYVAIMLFQG